MASIRAECRGLQARGMRPQPNPSRNTPGTGSSRAQTTRTVPQRIPLRTGQLLRTCGWSVVLSRSGAARRSSRPHPSPQWDRHLVSRRGEHLGEHHHNRQRCAHARHRDNPTAFRELKACVRRVPASGHRPVRSQDPKCPVGVRSRPSGAAGVQHGSRTRLAAASKGQQVAEDGNELDTPNLPGQG